MYLKTGVTGKELARAEVKYGIDKERKARDEKYKEEQIMKMLA